MIRYLGVTRGENSEQAEENSGHVAVAIVVDYTRKTVSYTGHAVGDGWTRNRFVVKETRSKYRRTQKKPTTRNMYMVKRVRSMKPECVNGYLHSTVSTTIDHAGCDPCHDAQDHKAIYRAIPDTKLITPNRNLFHSSRKYTGR